MRKATNYLLKTQSNYFHSNSIIGIFKIIPGHTGEKTYHMKKQKHRDSSLPKLERIDKLADDVKQLKSLTNLIIKKLESRS